MAIENKKIKIRRGTASAFSTIALEPGEPGFVTDQQKLYVGSDAGNVQINTNINGVGGEIDIEGAGGVTVGTNGQTITITGVQGTVKEVNGKTPNAFGEVDVVINDLPDVVINNPQDLQVLRYIVDNGVGRWKNTVSTDLNYWLHEVNAPSGANGDVEFVITSGIVNAGGEYADLTTITKDMTHTHGAVSSTGTVTQSKASIQTGDSLLISDGSAQDLLKESSITFDTANTTTFLAKDGTFKIPFTFTNGITLNGTQVSHTNTSDQESLTGLNESTVFNGIELDGFGHITNLTTRALTKSDIGLGNVTNESKATMFANAELTGIPIAPTAAPDTNTEQIATTAYVQNEIAQLIGGAPGALDTLNELAAAIGDNADFVGSINDAITTKLSTTGGTITGPVTFEKIGGVSATDAASNLIAFKNHNTLLGNQTHELRVNVGGNLQFDGSTVLTEGFIFDNYLNVRNEQTLTVFEQAQAIENLGLDAVDFQYLETISSDVQTQLNAKAPVNSPNFTGTPQAPTVFPDNSGRLATTGFVNQALAAVGAYTPAFTEWHFVQKYSYTDTGTLSIDNDTLDFEDFDFENNDYKFVVSLATSGEDASMPYIRLFGVTGSEYNSYSLSSRPSSLSNPSGTLVQVSDGEYGTTAIYTGSQLPVDNEGVALTNHHLEFQVRRSYIQAWNIGSPQYHYEVNGTASALATAGPTSPIVIIPIISTFYGSITNGNPNAAFNIDIIHNVNVGSSDSAVVRIYKRAK